MRAAVHRLQQLVRSQVGNTQIPVQDDTAAKEAQNQKQHAPFADTGPGQALGLFSS